MHHSFSAVSWRYGKRFQWSTLNTFENCWFEGTKTDSKRRSQFLSVCSRCAMHDAPTTRYFTRTGRHASIPTPSFRYQTSRSYATPSSSMATPFDVLNLPRNASPKEIKERYYELCKQLHPDRTGDNTPEMREKFARLVKAYDILSDAGRREMYIRTGYGWDVPLSTSRPNPATYSQQPGQRTAAYTNAYWADDISYKGGPWSSETDTRFASNNVVITFVAALVVFASAYHFATFGATSSALMTAADLHHMKTSRDLERVRTEAQLFGNQRVIERMYDVRMRYYRRYRDGEDIGTLEAEMEKKSPMQTLNAQKENC